MWQTKILHKKKSESRNLYDPDAIPTYADAIPTYQTWILPDSHLFQTNLFCKGLHDLSFYMIYYFI